MPTSSRNAEGVREGVRAAAGPWGAPPPYRPLSPVVRAALQAVYARVDSALAPVATACRACGECCRFKPGGIILFAGAVELAYLVEGARAATARAFPGEVEGSRADGITGGFRPRLTDRAQRRPAHPRPQVPWRCPYQQGDLCAARDARPLGCRTYFCDAAARPAGEQVHAEALRGLRQVVPHQATWWYGPACAWFERNLPGGVLR